MRAFRFCPFRLAHYLCQKLRKPFQELTLVKISQESAETLALQCLGWLAGNEELLPVFLGSTGASATDLRERVQDPEFLGSLLDFVMMNDAWVIEFCEANTVPYEHLKQARAALPGGEQMNWT
jgi:hypothetical protein